MFAKEINTYFPDRTMYLFDTFEGFAKKDVEVETKAGLADVTEHYYSETSEEMVLNRLPHSEKAIIRKGYFPETTKGLEDERFLFVNLDFDLYTPILEGLNFFSARMVSGGVILVHDYFSNCYYGVQKAVADFEKETDKDIIKHPIGDGISIAIIVK